jgi:hypothetical protein
MFSGDAGKLALGKPATERAPFLSAVSAEVGQPLVESIESGVDKFPVSFHLPDCGYDQRPDALTAIVIPQPDGALARLGTGEPICPFRDPDFIVALIS